MVEAHPKSLLEELRRHDTPTICNALEIIQGKRGGSGFTTEPFVCRDPSLQPLVGYARTATIRATAPSADPPDKMRARRIAYYEHVAAPPGPTIAVIEDLDDRPGFGAFWGEVNSTVHSGLGCLGVVTNGSIRDLDVIAPGFQMLAGKVGPSHAFVHPVEIGCPVTIFGMAVRDNDLLHADRHGAVVIPAADAAELPRGIDIMVRRERLLLDAARRPGFSVDDIRKALDAADDIH